ncbi:MAG: peptidylprolyl isomerase [Ruminiclostridium sp.]|nr:peptidylprolyl isomerase [Ruminiclostridium sp.]
MKLMKKAAGLLAGVMLLFAAASCGDDKAVGNLGDVKLEDNDVYAEITIMDYGTITAKLFEKAAPESVKRFIEFAELGYYNGTTIHRVIDNYMIQGGSLNGDGSDGEIPPNQYIPVETSNVAYNFYGALCFAASKNGSYAQFYIVDNHTPQDIDAVINKLTEQLADETITSRMLEKDKLYYQEYLNKLKAIPAEVKEKYASAGGLYELDGQNTVFGQVIDGYSVLKAVSAVEVVSGNPIDDRVGTPSKPIDPITIESIKIIRIEPEVTEETTTTKKPKNTKGTKDVVNAETLPTLESSTETGAEAEDGASDTTAPDDTSADTTTSAEMTTSADTTTAAAADESAPAETRETNEIEALQGSDDEVIEIFEE